MFCGGDTACFEEGCEWCDVDSPAYKARERRENRVHSNDLLPCPFCGNAASVSYGTNVDCMTQDNRPAIGCKYCMFLIHRESLKLARDVWNNRAR